MRGWVVFLWALVATLVLVTLGIFGTLIASGRIVLAPEPTPSATPVPTITPVVDTSYTVVVLNATPQSGLANQTKDTIVSAGWAPETVTAGEAGTDNFPTTTVYYVTAEAEPAALGLAQVLGGAATVLDPDYPLPGTAATQLTVVLGLDQIATPTPTPSG